MKTAHKNESSSPASSTTELLEMGYRVQTNLLESDAESDAEGLRNKMSIIYEYYSGGEPTPLEL